MQNKFLWRGDANDLGAASSWNTFSPDTNNSTGFGVATRPPDASDFAIIGVGGVLTGSSTEQQLNIDALGVSVTGPTTTTTPWMNIGVAAAGSVSVTSLWHNTGAFSIGAPASGSLTIDSGGRVDNDGEVKVGPENGGVGGLGTLTIRNGGQLNSGAGFSGLGGSNGASGTVTVDGDKSTWNSTGAILVSRGTLTVSNGGNVHVGRWISVGVDSLHDGGGTLLITTGGVLKTDAGNNDVGVSFASTATVTGSGSSWSMAGTLSVDGEGKVSATAGGFIEAADHINMLTGSVLSVDGSSRIEAGSAGGAQAGFLTIDASSSLGGAGEIQGSVIDSGTIRATGGTLKIDGAVAGTGTVTIDDGATLESKSSVTDGLAVSFNGGAGTLLLDDPVNFKATIGGLSDGDMIELSSSALAAAFGADATVERTHIDFGDQILELTMSSGEVLRYALADATSGHRFHFLDPSGGNVRLVYESAFGGGGDDARAPPFLSLSAPMQGRSNHKVQHVTGFIDLADAALPIMFFDRSTHARLPDSNWEGHPFGSWMAWSADVTLSPDGQYSVYAQATNAAGTTTNGDVFFTVDTSPPDTVITSKSLPPTNNRDQILKGITGVQGQFDREAGTSILLYRDGSTISFFNPIPVSIVDGTWSQSIHFSVDGTYTYYAQATDLAGNVGESSNKVTITIDTTPPDVRITPLAPSATNKPAQIIKGTVDLADAGRAVTVFDNNKALPEKATSRDGTWSVPVTLVGDGPHTLVAHVTDAAGNTGASNSVVVTLDRKAPTIAQVSATSASPLGVGQAVAVKLVVSEPVSVVGAPTLTLNDGATATYNAGSSTATSLAFDYVVAAKQNTADLKITGVTLPKGTTITDAAGNALNAALTSAQADLHLVVDTTPPAVTKVAASPASGAVASGSDVTITLTMNEVVTVTSSPVLTLNDGATATFVGGSGTNALVFKYHVGAESTTDLRVTGINQAGGTIHDNAGNPLSSTLAADLKLQTNVFTFIHTTGGGDWNAAANWSPAGVPAAGSTALLTKPGTYAVTSNQANTVAILNTAAGATLAIGSASTFAATGGTGAGGAAGKITVADGATLALAGAFKNTGTIALGSSAGTTRLVVLATLTLSGAGKIALADAAGAIDNDIASDGTQAATIINAGNAIAGAGTIGDPLLTLTNQAAGVVNGSGTSHALTLSATTTNAGVLEGTTVQGLVITGAVASNSKTIEALGTNARLAIQSAIANTSTGVILASGSGAHVDLNGATITGGKLQTTGANAVIAAVGGSNVVNGASIAAGATVQANAGATLTIAGAVANAGTLLANGGTLDIMGTVTGGTVKIGATGTVEIAAAGSNRAVSFAAGSTGTLQLDDARGYTGTVAGLSTIDALDLRDIVFAHLAAPPSYVGTKTRGVLTVGDSDGHTAKIALLGNYINSTFTPSSDGHGGTMIVDPITMATASPLSAARHG